MASTIGIKVANGEFYPIMEENSMVKRRLVLTTAHDNQKSVQIDLYNSFAKTMADALYVGSLAVENIKPRPKGEPSIEMILASNTAGEISADVVGLDSSVDGEKQHLSVSLTSMEEDGVDEFHDFELDSGEHPPRELYDNPFSPQHSRKKSSPWILVSIAATLLLLIGGLLYFFFLNDRGIAIRTGLIHRPAVSAPEPPVPAAAVPAAPAAQTTTAPATQTATVPAAPAAQTTTASAPAPVAQAPSVPAPAAPAPAVPVISSSQQIPRAEVPRAAQPSRTRTLPPVASYKVPQTIPRGGASYIIRWGDTLWDISEAFYRNPWLYPRIVRFNNIRNPDHIISGTVIKIPPRN
ncbi:MAG: LysM peptidoglycan-binding domain-containing protein [Treponema sp.]|nr:LysM peptidoglycan-binding domain-containing protein [Treponema sp.]